MDSKKEPPDESGLIEAYLRSDKAAFATINDWIVGHLKRRYPRMSHQVEDLSQTVHTRLVVNLTEGRFEGRSALKSYVHGITHRVAIDRLRVIYRERAFAESASAEEPAARDNPYDAAELKDEAELCRRVLFSLPERCRQLWRLTFVDKLHYEEIGRRLAIAAGTVKSRLFRCRQSAQAAVARLRRRS